MWYCTYHFCTPSTLCPSFVDFFYVALIIFVFIRYWLLTITESLSKSLCHTSLSCQMSSTWWILATNEIWNKLDTYKYIFTYLIAETKKETFSEAFSPSDVCNNFQLQYFWINVNIFIWNCTYDFCIPLPLSSFLYWFNILIITFVHISQLLL